MQNRTFKLKSTDVINSYFMAENGEKHTKKVEKRAMNKHRRTLEKREVRKLAHY